jgi:hypothetical protein
MIITTEYVDLPVDGSTMRMFVAGPKAEGRYPGVVFYSDIFQLTDPMLPVVVKIGAPANSRGRSNRSQAIQGLKHAFLGV